LHTLLCPVRVQGAQAAPDIIAAIERVNLYHQQLSRVPFAASSSPAPLPIDLILLVRGGGSLEDLWAFNEESLARAIAASRIAIATGIGHEPDTTIADLVGDLRGPTPTGIAELTIPDVRSHAADLASKSALLTRDLRRLLEHRAATLDRAQLRLDSSLTEALRNRQLRIDLLCKQIERIEPRHAIAQGWRRVEEGERRLETAMHHCIRARQEALSRASYRLERCSPLTRLQRHRDRLEHLTGRLQAAARARASSATQKVASLADHLRIVSPQAILDRGFSITTRKDGAIVRSPSQVHRGEVITTRVAEGVIDSTVGKPRQSTLF
jgi:exodeoxyribonuclease VII large subunit